MTVVVKPLFERLKNEGLHLRDSHAHVFLSEELNRRLLSTARTFNVGEIYASIYPFDLSSFAAPHDEIRRANELVTRLQKETNRLIRGLVYLNPQNDEDLRLAKHLINEGGFAGIGELYRVCKPWQAREIFVLAEQLDVPVLVHTAHRLYPRDRSREATPDDIARVARDFPRLRIVMAHITGGGDWEYSLEVVRRYANVYVDIGGSVPDAGVIEKAVELLGPERVLFASDCLYAESVGRVEAASVAEHCKRMFYYENAERVFQR